MSGLFVGIMSGTSLDAADAVLADLSAPRPRLLAAASVPFPDTLRATLRQISEPGHDGLDAAGECSLQLAALYAEATRGVLSRAGKEAGDVIAIGCHGQTVRHRPERGYTIQLNDPARVAELTGIDVVADFRSRDLAAGGQGAPLAPVFHDAVFRDAARRRAIVNIGGFSNTTILHPGREVSGFDCGPGNLLLDHWAHTHLRAAFDEHGAWARTGRVLPPLLDRFLSEPFLHAPPPKSTGRERFGPHWLPGHLSGEEAAPDVQATLMEFTALAIVRSIERFAAGTQELFLCGGGARNTALVERVAALASPAHVGVTDDLGVDAAWVEAMAFAWLAKCCVDRQPLQLGAVTGARHACVLGAIYPR